MSEDVIKSGFFDALLIDDPEHPGEQIYDKTYSSSDFNEYFKGIINQNGVFSNVRDYDLAHEKNYLPFEMEAGSDGLTVFVHGGKALVYGHWVEIFNGDSVTFDPAHTVYTRRDAIVLRYDNVERTITLASKKGVASSDGIQPIWPAGFSTATNTFFGLENNIAEILLGWVDITPNAEHITQNMITSRIGNYECPWISHILYGPNQVDTDAYLAKMKGAFEDWFRTVQNDLTINSNIIRYRKTVYSHSGSTSTTISLANMDVTPSWEDPYIYDESTDIITIYYNGLAITDPSNWTIENRYDETTQKTTSWITLSWIPIDPKSNQFVIPKGNGVDIIIERSKMGGIENCINHYY